MSSLITTGSVKRALMPGVRVWAGLDYKEHEQEYKELFETKRSDKAFEIEMTMGPTGLFTVKNQGGNVGSDSYSQGFKKEYTHVEYSSSLTLTHAAIVDNQYAEIAEYRAKQLGRAARITKETVAAAVPNLATDTAYVGADGLPLASTAHLMEKGGTYRNRPTSGTDLSEASLEQAVIDMADYRDGANKRIKVMPRKLVVPVALMFKAERILNSSNQNDTANNAINALRSKGLFSGGATMNHYLTDTNAWFVLTDIPNGLIHYQREDLRFADDVDVQSENVRFQAVERYSFGWTDPRCIYYNPGSS